MIEKNRKGAKSPPSESWEENIIYQTIITLKQNLNPLEIEKANQVFSQAFNNRAGKLENKSNDKYQLLFEDTEFFGALSIGEIAVYKSNLGDYIDKWTSIDPYEPSESCDNVWKEYHNTYQRLVT